MADVKDFKKLLKTRTSVLVCFTRSTKDSAALLKLLAGVAETIRGTGAIVAVDCGG